MLPLAPLIGKRKYQMQLWRDMKVNLNNIIIIIIIIIIIYLL
jgi:hypothetical protein